MRIIDLWKVVLLASIARVRGTIDVNLLELEYLAARLDLVECRRLVAALHYHSYELPESLKDAAIKISPINLLTTSNNHHQERNIDDDIPCLRLLLHWNSAASEGLGESHELLERRLRQLGYRELADWLGKTTFRELGKDLLRSVNEPFPDVTTINVDETTTNVASTRISLVEDDKIDDDDWSDVDLWRVIETLMIGLFCLLLFTLILVVGALVIDKFAWCDNEEVSDDNRKLLSIN